MMQDGEAVLSLEDVTPEYSKSDPFRNSPEDVFVDGTQEDIQAKEERIETLKTFLSHLDKRSKAGAHRPCSRLEDRPEKRKVKSQSMNLSLD